MTIASVHVADVGVLKALRMLRGPRRVPGLVSAEAAVAAPLRGEGTALPSPMPGRIGLVAFWQDDEALTAFVEEHPYGRRLGNGWWSRMEPLRAYGSWPGLPADVEPSRTVANDGPTVVVTLGGFDCRGRASSCAPASPPRQKHRRGPENREPHVLDVRMVQWKPDPIQGRVHHR